MNKVFLKRVLKDFIDLGEIEIKTGPFGTQLHASDYVEKGTAVINVRNIGYGRIKTDKLEYINEETVQRLSSHLLKHNDIVFGRKGAVDRHALIMLNQQGLFQGSDCLRIRIKSESLDPLFLSYYFLTDNHKKWMMAQCSHGATMASLNQDIISRVPVSLPNIQIQQKIASILSNYDDLIENNTRRIEILEQMAKLVYKEWLVKFRFPGHEKVKMVYSELGQIPEGWEILRIENLLSSLESGSRPRGGVGDLEDGIPSIGAENIIGLGIYDFSKEKYVSSEFFNKMKKGIVKHKDVLLYKDGAKIGRKTIFRNSFPHEQCCINEHVFILRAKDRNYQNYLYFWLDLDFMTENIKNLNSNAAQPGINQKDVRSLPILVPPIEIILKVDEILEPILSQIFVLAKKNQNLHKTRDLLLPKLISREIDVSDLDIRIKNEYQESNFNFGEPQDEKGFRFKVV